MPRGTDLNATAITSGRRTVVTIDESLSTLSGGINQDLRMERIGDASLNGRDLGAAPAKEGYRVAFKAGMGWRLLSSIEKRSVAQETSAFDAGELAPGSGLQSHPNLLAFDTVGPAGGGIPSGNLRKGGKAFQRQIPAGGSYTDELSADKDSYPPPTDDGETIPLIRIASSSADYTRLSGFSFVFQIPVVNLSVVRRGTLCRLYFPGTAGSVVGDPSPGTGRYVLSFSDDGTAGLRERLASGAWRFRAQMRWAGGGAVPSGFFRVDVETSESGDGARLLFGFGPDSGQDLAGILADVLQAARAPSLETVTYPVPNPGVNASQPTRLRIDERGDVRGVMALRLRRHYTQGSLRSHILDAGTVVGTPFAGPVYVNWDGDRPSGCAVTPELYDAETGQKLNPTSDGGSYASWGYQGFDAPNGPTGTNTGRKLFVRLLLSTSNPAVSPTIRAVRVYRRESPVAVRVGDDVNPDYVASVSVMGADADPSHASARLVLPDPRNRLDLLRTRAQMPARVDVRYDPADPSKVSTIASGYVALAKRKVRGSSRRAGMAKAGWATYDVRMAGEWQRLWESKTTKSWEFGNGGDDQGGTSLFKITTIVRRLLGDAGYPEECIDVPDLPIRLFAAGDQSQGMRLEPLSEIGPFLVDLVRDYLGGWLVWDPNATNLAAGTEPLRMGCWRLRFAPRPTGADGAIEHYPLAVIGLGPYSGGLGGTFDPAPGSRMPYGVRSLPKVAYKGRQIPRSWFRKGSYEAYIVPAEGNVVTVTGSGVAGVLSDAAHSASSLTAQIINPFSHPRSKLYDRSHPDGLGGRVVEIYHGDPAIGTQAHANFVCRRIYDACAHAQVRVTGECPLILVTDPRDGLQRRPRPLMFGDCVLVDGRAPDGSFAWVPMYVAAPMIDYDTARGGDRVQMGVLELFSPYDVNGVSMSVEGLR